MDSLDQLRCWLSFDLKNGRTMVGQLSSWTFFPAGTRKSFEVIFIFTPSRVVASLMDERLHDMGAHPGSSTHSELPNTRP
jgi:hypothetical protein